MSLQEIYLWFTENQQNVIARKGWKKSIRHNLSMNTAFSPPDSVGTTRERGLWRLDPAAVALGRVPPTSRGRKSR
ncbi:hypothetical protein EDB81DRAFT_826528 [Dactylonectria macrodidyma]|uniref:Fork-head domain-containing protein n=1 Tax=Dactylonectria macrodidyma TaxID=307937 RepID=A0A9P9D5F1_9HYPO|nr:hypothetical protein EDB81DRAFT_826528 [Dactylonectria macrodidyma]